jgi:hypothetical protein
MTLRPAGALRLPPFRLPALIAVLAAAAALPPGAARAADLFVTSADDTVNGDTSSPDALAAQPGPDGISLREAILAADNAPGPHRIELSSILSARPLVLASDLPPITRDRISLVGPTGRAGEPLVTIAGSPVSVFASHFRASGLRFTAARGAVFFVFAGTPDFPGSGAIADVRIENDVFDGTDSPELGHGVAIGTPDGSDGASIRGVTISGNTFLRFRGDVAAVICDVGGTGGVIRGLTVDGNTFVENSVAVRVGIEGSHGRLSAVAITGNEFLDDGIALAAISGALPGHPPSTDGIVEGIRIEGNRIRGGENSAIYFLAGGAGATGLAIRDVDIVNDAIWSGSGFAIGGQAGSGPGSVGNRIEGIRVTNDTIAVGAGRSGTSFDANSYGAEGNSISGIEALNTIFDGPGTDFAGDASPSSVSHCIVGDPRYAGANGNFSADPAFVDPAAGDFHLKPGSTAIGKGRVTGAPCADLEGRARLADGEVDIGAYEFGAPYRPRPCPVVPAAGREPAIFGSR